ncbi:MAG: 4'-phosphopantetheinyl transferase superfamily protein [bacterium]|nr:4'-phosphopantetheinyl transferase superfamily protein [bacterium]
MQLIAVSNSYLADQSVIDKYFSSKEVKYLSEKVSKEQLDDRYLGRIALKHSITNSNFSQFIIDYINFGEPILVNVPNMFCSIAHSYGLGVAAASPFKIGVDVEKIRKHDDSLLKYIASTKEISLLKEENQDILVTKVWVIKEAVSKALGIGIAYPFINLLIEKDKGNYTVTTNGIKWFVKIFQYNDYIIGYCCQYPDSKKCNINIKYLQ